MTAASSANDSLTSTTERKIVFVTGPSGAGRSTALNVLEDAGYEAIDNVPFRLLPALLDDPGDNRSIALGIDTRTQGFSAEAMIDQLRQITKQEGLNVELLFLDCAAEVLLRRFSETRRRHPMAQGGPPILAINREQELLRPLRSCADVMIDTSQLNIHDLRAEIEQWFAPGGQRYLGISVQSFSYKRGLPRSVDMVYDCRFLRNPHWEPALRSATGLDAPVKDYISADPRFASFSDQVLELSRLLLPAFREEGKSNVSIAFGCTGGQHRSVALAEIHALRLAKEGWQVSIRHRELERQQHG
ncbi:MAG: RNase adapter RapZ [Sulfitobacter sp.]